MKPTLEIVSGNPGIHNNEVAERIASIFELSEEQRDLTVATGRKIYISRVLWALTYLRQAGLISTNRGISRVTEQGSQFLTKAGKSISVADLKQFPGFLEFSGGTKRRSLPEVIESVEVTSPAERFHIAAKEIESAMLDQILDALKQTTPSRFEQIIVDLMLRLGYGSEIHGSGKVVGKSGDGGIDGVIKLDRLGLDKVYLQAKRYVDSTVSIGEVNSFIGALSTRGATRGVFITTSKFSDAAQKAVLGAHHLQVSLIDGVELTKLMKSVHLGVSVESSFEIVRLDSEYFEI